ncbi:MAG TPA: thiamine-phosphate kinase [Polyangiaceae bacterium]
MSERDLIRFLSRVFATKGTTRVATLGVGDDAAVLRGVRGRPIWTVDVAVEGVHFDRRYLSLFDIGARSFHAAVSDLAAMGARPLAALSGLVVPSALGGSAVREIARGQAEAARDLRCPVVGGNLSRGGELSVTTSALGVADRPLTRAGARVGDEVWLVGDVGLAAAGLRLLSAPHGRKGLAPSARKAVDKCVAAFRRPRALVRAGMRLVGRAHAVIDVSDGLAGDAGHLAEASGVRLVLEEAALRHILGPELRQASELLGEDALDLALEGGEDYALVATGPARSRLRGLRRIGRVEKGRGVVVEGPSGSLRRAGHGFDHFSGRRR